MKCGFFNGNNNYGQEEFARYFSNIYENGVNATSSDMGLRVTRYSGESLRVSTGFALIEGYFGYQDVEKTIKITKNPTYDRIDRIVVRLDIGSMNVDIFIKEGIASSKPVAPSITTTSLVYELSLAQIYVSSKNGITIVTDERYTDLCGAIRPKKFNEFNTMITGMQDKFKTWFDNQQSKGWRNIYIQSNKPDAIEGSIWIQRL